MPHGTVKFFNAAKGFGFITADETAQDVFVPAASLKTADIAVLKPGQRIAFETASDKKGPKAIDLKIVAPAPAPKPPRPVQQEAVDAAPQALTLYVDGSDAVAAEMLAELRRAGLEPLVVDYVLTPPSREELKRLSMLLRDCDQNLVKRYDALFQDLQLDDRFIGDSEYWTAIFEHPTLINGPVIAMAARAGVCRSKAAVRSFLAAPAGAAGPVAAKRKELSPALLRMMNGGGATPPVAKDTAIVQTPSPQDRAAPVKEDSAPQAPKLKPKSSARAKPAPRAAAKKPAAKPLAKTRKR